MIIKKRNCVTTFIILYIFFFNSSLLTRSATNNDLIEISILLSLAFYKQEVLNKSGPQPMTEAFARLKNCISVPLIDRPRYIDDRPLISNIPEPHAPLHDQWERIVNN